MSCSSCWRCTTLQKPKINKNKNSIQRASAKSWLHVPTDTSPESIRPRFWPLLRHPFMQCMLYSHCINTAMGFFFLHWMHHFVDLVLGFSGHNIIITSLPLNSWGKWAQCLKHNQSKLLNQNLHLWSYKKASNFFWLCPYFPSISVEIWPRTVFPIQNCWGSAVVPPEMLLDLYWIHKLWLSLWEKKKKGSFISRMK